MDLRTDIWSLGVALYELATGKPPFKGEHEQAVIRSIIYDSPLPPTEIRDGCPKTLERIIMKCLRKNRDDRYPSARSLLSDLKELKEFLKGEKQDEVIGQEGKPETTKETERRQATVVFAEIMGYNRMLKKIDAEEAASIMNACFKMFGSIVETYGGKIDNIMGSSLTALFGVPAAVEDAPKMAVNAAMEMRNRLYDFNREKKSPTTLDIRIGINTGMVITGVVGTDEKSDYSIVGDTVTFASRLKDFAKKGKIYAGPLTYKFTKDEFDYKKKFIILKGKTKPTIVFKLLSSKKKIYRFDPELHSEMVGRDKELDKLKLHLLKVINGEGSIISIIGEAGIGKSRLMEEFKKTGDFEKVTLLEGRPLSSGKSISYHLIRDILKKRAAIKEEESETDSLSRLERTVTNICPENAAEIFPFVAALMGMKLSGKYAERVKDIEHEAMKKLILKSMHELIIKSAEQRPIVFVIENLHLADISSIEMLESFFRLAENNPILFINVLRPNYKETGERVMETADIRHAGFHTKIYLEPLDEKECDTLIRNLVKVDEFPSGISTAITKRTGGNPFFIEEVVRSYFDEGTAELIDGEFKLVKKIDTAEIPKTVQDVLMAKIDSFDDPTKTLLKEAAVIGRYFFYKVLAEVTETEGDIDERLRYLKESWLIQEQNRLGEIEYFFKHPMARESVYESILQKKRKELHLKVAAAIESVFPEKLQNFYGMLALHYSRGENPEKAEDYLIMAGEETLKAAAPGEALTLYKDALNRYLGKYADAADPEKIALLEKYLARAFYNKGHMVEAVKHFDKAVEIWGEKKTYFVIDLLRVIITLYFPLQKSKLKPSDRDNDIFEVNYLRGTALISIDSRRMVRDSIRLLKNIFKYNLAEVRSGVPICTSASGIFFFSGLSFGIARKLLAHARRHINPDNRKDVFIYDLWELAYNTIMGKWDRELHCDTNEVDICLQDGDQFTAPSHLLFSSILAVEQGKFDAVRVYTDKLFEIGEVYENDFARVLGHLMRTKFLLQKRRLFDAFQEVEEGIALSIRVEQDILLLNFYGLKANILVLQGDMEGAEEVLRRTGQLVLREETVPPPHLGNFHLSHFLFDIYGLEKNIRGRDKIKTMQSWKDARRSGRDAKKTASKCAIYRTEAYKLKGLYYWLTGRQKKALTWWGKSIRSGQQLDAGPELARTYMEVGKRLMEKKSKFRQWNGINAPQYLKKARRLFEDMEMEWDLQLLDKIESPAEKGEGERENV